MLPRLPPLQDALADGIIKDVVSGALHPCASRRFLLHLRPAETEL